MQDRYSGDIGDFIKLGLLRALAPGRRLGVAWFKTPDETHNSDGRHVGYLDQPERWRHLDADLFAHLRETVSSGKRSISMLEPTLPPSTLCHDRVLSSPAERRAWWSDLRQTLDPADLLFVDPDNGLAPAGLSRGSRKSIKSIFWDEVAQLRRPRRALLVYHHQTRAKGGHHAEATSIAARLVSEGAQRVLVLRARVWSPRLFVLIDGDDALETSAREFADRWAGAVAIVDTEEAGSTAPEAPASDLALILSAASFAADRHRQQRRKDADASPYINHPLALASILAVEGGVTDPATIAAALLHDVVEDTETTLQEVEARFGSAVASIVAEVTDDKNLPKEVRKQLQVEKASGKSEPAKLVKLADKIANLRDIATCPPADWSRERRSAYFDWAAQVVQGLRGTNDRLEYAFDRALADRPSSEFNDR
ncbi:MAG: HD domain-containing protein [Allosphingosinicella sp.]|uniref:HD domain-containing protein n=1 Tax=Allosphingosinicella sp. TaxID=2823234 RepID=UPI00395E58DE